MSSSDWLLKSSLTKIQGDPSIADLGRKFTNSSQIIRVNSSIKKSTWNYGGKLYATYLVAGQQTIVASFEINLNFQQLIQVPRYFPGAYSLFFLPPKWLVNYSIKVFEYQNMPLYLSDQSVNNAISTVANVTSVTVQNNTTPISLLATNPNRKRFSLRNKGTKSALIGFTNTFTAANAYLSLAAGAVYESDITFTGEIFGLAPAANSPTDIAVIEFV
jgi:hypothetical protein